LAEIERQTAVRRIEAITSAHVETVQSEGAGFQVSVAGNDGNGRRELGVGAIVVAVGFEPFDARLKGEFGYGRYPAVMTALDAEQMLLDKGRILAPDGSEPTRAAFIQCVGSRDASLGRPYCSRICCAYALRMAALLRHDSPQCEIAVFYMDFQPLGKKFEAIRQGLAADGKVRLLRSTPAKIYGWEGEKDVEVRYFDPATGGLTAEPFDLVILSIGLGGPAQNGFLPGLGRNEDGFLSAEDEGRVFLAGSCREPKAISEAMSEGRRIALRLAMSLGAQE
jgi:heterodisulfide reductase subunit A